MGGSFRICRGLEEQKALTLRQIRRCNTGHLCLP
jgi:hypothetical protein